MARSHSATPSAIVLELAEEFLERYRRGERPPLQEYIDRHREFSEEIRTLFPALAMLEKIALADSPEMELPASDSVRPGSLGFDQIGDFRILREIGRGGMGVVFEAEQVSLGRHVALKLLPMSLLRVPKHRRRFEREARAAARLTHANIVPVFGIGEHQGTPYYAMQFIAGRGLDEVLDELRRLRAGMSREKTTVPYSSRQASKGVSSTAAEVARSLWTGQLLENQARECVTEPGLSIAEIPPETYCRGHHEERARSFSTASFLGPGPVSSGGGSHSSSRSAYWRGIARIGVQVAEALAYAHLQGVLHRDIKPSNLLLDDRGTVWVTDFGLSKIEDQQDLTDSHDVVGTLRYIPPEAFEGQSGARGDIYSLGLTLYELLALRPAFEETDRVRLVRLITGDEPPRLRKLNPEVPRDLETVIHKAIDRDPDHRYQTAAELAEDLKLFVEDRPVRARPASEVEKFLRWCRRNPVPAGLIAALLVVFWIGFGLVAWKWREADAQRIVAVDAGRAAQHARDQAIDSEKTAREAAERAGRSLYFSNIDRARLERLGANIAEAEAILDRCEPNRRGWEWHFLKELNHAELLTLHGHDGWVDAVACSPDGKWIATAGGGNPFYGSPGQKVVPGTVIVWDAGTGRAVFTLREHRHLVHRIAFSPDSRILASSSHDGTIHLHEVSTGRLVRTIAVARGVDSGPLAFSPDGRRLTTWTNDRTIAIEEITTGVRPVILPAQPFGYLKAVFSPDGRWLATTSLISQAAASCYLRVWDAATGAEAIRPDQPLDYISLAISPDSQTLAAGSMSGYISVWNLSDGRLRQTLVGHEGTVEGLAFSFDGQQLASASRDRTARLWDLERGKAIRVIRGHTENVTSLAFSPDGDRLVTGSQDGTARVWDLTFDEETGGTEFDWGWYGHEPPFEAMAFAREGREVRGLRRDGFVSQDGVGSFDRIRQRYGDYPLPWRVPSELAAFDAEGRRLVTIDADSPREAVCLDIEDGLKPTRLRGHTLEIQAVTLSADGKRAATAASSGAPEYRTEIVVWDAVSGDVLLRRVAEGEAIDRLALDPTGKRLAIAGAWTARTTDAKASPPVGFVAVVEVATGREEMRRQIPDDRCLALGFSGDARRLAAAGMNRTVVIWDPGSDRVPVSSRQGPSDARDLAFSPDGRRLAVASRRQVKLMDAETAEEVLTLRGRAQLVSSNHEFNPRVRFSPDGRSLFAICFDMHRSLAMWSIPPETSGEPAARIRMARRRAVTRHLEVAFRFREKFGIKAARLVREHLDHAARIGLEWASEFLTRAEILLDLGLIEQADDDLARAVALAPRDETILGRAVILLATHGQFRRAAHWLTRLSIRTPAAFHEYWGGIKWALSLVLVGDHARYRQFSEELLRSLDSRSDKEYQVAMAYFTALEPIPADQAETRVRIARRALAHLTAAGDMSWRRTRALFALGAALVRAGAPDQAEPPFREVIAREPEEMNRARAAAWLAIALRQQGRLDEARAWFDRADRFLHAQEPGGLSHLEHRPPESVNHWQFWALFLAWREAQTLILDDAFPTDPFAR